MHISEKLIRDFLTGKCTEEERRMVTVWFRENPDQLEKYLTEESWHSFSAEKMNGDISERMFEKINERIDKKVIFIRRFGWVAAASVVLLISASVFYLNHHSVDRSIAVDQNKPEKKENLLFATEKNDLTTPKKIILPEGSVVVLSSGSSISYNSSFNENRRDIFLTGEANFKVAKDPSKPFCVHSNKINTTALGTMFTVNAKNEMVTTVKLFEGKVVVRNEEKAPHVEDVFLSPGHELSFNNKSLAVDVHAFRPEENPETKKIAVLKPAVALDFNNKPLQEVFKELQKQYHVKIKYDTAAIGDMNFTGMHKSTSETLDEFLNTIAKLNDLIIKKNGQGYTVRRIN
ncbi:MAG TPA: FecR domain-containing protein [Puia sp.]|nr:FecR domain-containing protein [Puia sp.]